MGMAKPVNSQPPTPIPTSEASYMGWRLRPKGIDQGEGLQDRDPRGHISQARLEEGTSVRGQGSGQLTSLVPGPRPLRSAESEAAPRLLGPTPYVELHCHTCYSFREGASRP